MISKIKFWIFDKRYTFANYFSDYFAEKIKSIIDCKNVENENGMDLFNHLSCFYKITHKINFLKRDLLKEYLMEDYFDRNNKNYKRIENFYDFICYSLCGIKKNESYFYLFLMDMIFDLEDTEKPGEIYKYEI